MDMKERALIVTGHMTQSKISRWAGDCQQKFAYSHIHEIKKPPSAALAFGSGWDRFNTASEGSQDPYKDEPETLDGFFATKLKEGKNLPESQARDLFVEAFRQEADLVEDWGKDDKNDLEKLGQQGVHVFLQEDADAIEPIKLQTSLQIGVEDDTGPWALTGTLDLVAKDERFDENPCIHDQKTAKRRWSAGQAQGSLQSIHYSLLVKHNPGFEGVDVDRFRYDILVKNKTPVLQHEGAEIDDAMRESHLRLASSVRKEVIEAASREYFRPNRQSWLCSRKLCGYWEICEKTHGGRVKE